MKETLPALARLRAASTELRSCILTAPAARTSSTAVIWEVTDERLRLAFEQERVREELHPRSICLLTFGDQHGTSASITRVVESDERGVVLETPNRFVSFEGRLTFRVPLRGEHGLNIAVVLDDGSALPAEPINISMGGLLAELRAPIALEAESELRLSLERQGVAVALAAILRHRSEERLGLAFKLQPGRGGEPTVPTGLKNLVMAVQQHWLQTRVP